MKNVNKVLVGVMMIGGMFFTSCEKEDGISQIDVDNAVAAQVASDKVVIDALQAQFDSITSQLNDSNGQIAVLIAGVSDLEAAIAELETENDAVQAELQATVDAAIAAAQAAADEAKALVDSGDVLFAFTDGVKQFNADGSPILLDYDGNVTTDATVSNAAYIQKVLDLYRAIIETYGKLLG